MPCVPSLVKGAAEIGCEYLLSKAADPDRRTNELLTFKPQPNKGQPPGLSSKSCVENRSGRGEVWVIRPKAYMSHPLVIIYEHRAIMCAYVFDLSLN